MRFPFIDQPNSSAAERAAWTDPGPDALESGPFISTITPILMTSFEIWAHPEDPNSVAKITARQTVAGQVFSLRAPSPVTRQILSADLTQARNLSSMQESLTFAFDLLAPTVFRLGTIPFPEKTGTSKRGRFGDRMTFLCPSLNP
jgi:hypothetical protein